MHVRDEDLGMWGCRRGSGVRGRGRLRCNTRLGDLPMKGVSWVLFVFGEDGVGKRTFAQ